MRSPLICSVQSLIFLTFSFFCSCLAQPQGQPHGNPKTIRLPIIKRTASDLSTRQISTSLSNQIRTYMIDVEIGSTGQRSRLSLDTGSADTWTFMPSACRNCTGGSYNESHSSTDIPRADLGGFELSYLDGTTASGLYHNDDVVIGGIRISNVTFAMVDHTGETQHGILGLGPQALQSSVLKYPTILDAMKEQGLIDWRGFSMQLNAETSSEGQLVFGGWDAENYQFMPSVPMWKEEDQVHRLAIDWNSIVVKSANGSVAYSNTTISQPVTLDSGYTLSTLPDEIFSIVAKEFRVKKSGDNYYSPCEQPEGSVELRFGGSQLSLSIPFSELSIPANLQPGGDIGQDLCMFGFRPASSWGGRSDMLSFGDTILRSAYLLVDYDNMMIGMTQANRALCQNCTGATAGSSAADVRSNIS